MKHLRSLMIAISVLVGSVSGASAQDYFKGLSAARAGDFQTTLQEWRPLAEQGNSDAQRNLGLMYYNGDGVLQDYVEAVKWFQLAAEQGNATAQNNLGAMYKVGQGVLQNNVMAHMWYNIAAANGHDKAGERRDERAGLMTDADISKTQELARECMNSNYQNCGY